MRRARYILAATLVATALCADRATAGVPSSQREATQFAERLVSRLSASFRRTVPAVRIFISRHPNASATVCSVNGVALTDVQTSPFAYTPFQFRLPPPTV